MIHVTSSLSVSGLQIGTYTSHSRTFVRPITIKTVTERMTLGQWLSLFYNCRDQGSNPNRIDTRLDKRATYIYENFQAPIVKGFYGEIIYLNFKTKIHIVSAHLFLFLAFVMYTALKSHQCVCFSRYIFQTRKKLWVKLTKNTPPPHI